MPRSSAVVLATLFGMSLFSACKPRANVPPSTGATRAITHPSDKELNLGTIIRGAERRGEFSFVNATDEWIEVRRWRTSCECLRVTAGSTEIAPRDVAEISVIGHFPADGQPGRVRVEVEGLDGSGDAVVNFDVVMRLAEQDDTADGKRSNE